MLSNIEETKEVLRRLGGTFRFFDSDRVLENWHSVVKRLSAEQREAGIVGCIANITTVKGFLPTPSPADFARYAKIEVPSKSSLDPNKWSCWKDAEGRDMAYNSAIKNSLPPTKEGQERQVKLERSGISDWTGMKRIIEAVNQQERGRSKDVQ